MHDKIGQLRELGQKIEGWRQAQDWTVNALCREYGQLGSSKTFGRILDAQDDLSEGMDIDKQFLNYRAAWELMQEREEDPEENKIYTDFDFMKAGLSAIAEAVQQTDITRFVLITGLSGAGKSTLLDALQAHPRLGAITSRVEATEAWRAKTTDFLGALLMEMGHYDDKSKKDGSKEEADRGRKPELPQSTNARLEKLIERLDGRRRILAIDEFHHVGPEGYNMVKTIINRTKAVVVGVAIPELITRINKSNHAEAKQLFFNRLYEHVRFGEPRTGDVLEFMRRRGMKFASEKDAGVIAKSLASDSYEFGMWKYVKRCVKRANRSKGKAWTAEDFKDVVVRVKNSISL